MSQFGENAGLPDLWTRTGLIVVTSPAEASRFDLEEDVPPDRVAGLIGDRLVDSTSDQGQPPQTTAICVGHAGTALAVLQAQDWLDRTLVERVLVVGVDSYLDPLSLAWVSPRRLKTSENPSGLAPGEAGACFMLAAGQSISEAPLAWITSASVGREVHQQPNETPNQAVALAEAVATVLPPGTFDGDIICDLNGEPWRSRELGSLQVRLGDRLGEGQVMVPAVSLGEIGAASGAVGVCVAVRSHARGYASGRQSIVVSLSEDGHVGALHLTV